MGPEGVLQARACEAMKIGNLPDRRRVLVGRAGSGASYAACGKGVDAEAVELELEFTSDGVPAATRCPCAGTRPTTSPWRDLAQAQWQSLLLYQLALIQPPTPNVLQCAGEAGKAPAVRCYVQRTGFLKPNRPIDGLNVGASIIFQKLLYQGFALMALAWKQLSVGPYSCADSEGLLISYHPDLNVAVRH